MKTSRILGGIFAALTIGILVAGIASIDPAAASGVGVMSMAIGGMVTIKAPVTLHNGDQYVAPGTEVTLPKAEADALVARHGRYDHGSDEVDPGSTLRKTDVASIAALNEHAKINKGNGKSDQGAGGGSGSEPAKLKGMSKPELIAQAAKEGVTLDPADTAPEIADKIEAHRAKA